MNCEEKGNKCPPKVEKLHVVIHKWVSVPSGIGIFRDILELSGIDEDSNLIPHSEFAIEQSDTGKSLIKTRHL